MPIAKPFQSPAEALGGIDARTAAALLATASDVALILDSSGVIRDLALGSEELLQDGCETWLGQPWASTVTIESRPKIEALLRDAGTGAPTDRRHVNHVSARGTDVPVLYSTFQIAGSGHSVAVGRDLRAVAALQQQLVEAQQSMERDYWRLRHAETRYRLLFQMASEAVLIVDAASQKVIEANPAAVALLETGGRRLVGRAFPDGFDEAGTAAILAQLARVRTTGRAGEVVVRRTDGGGPLRLAASLFRNETSTLLLVRLAPELGATSDRAPGRGESTLVAMLERAPDGFVVTTPEGRILAANPAFVELAQLTGEEQARGESLERWLGRPGVDLGVLLANLRQHGSVRLFATSLRGELGATADIEISAVAVPHLEEPCLGFILRNVGRRLGADPRIGREQPRSVEQLTQLVGRVPLKELVREATDLIEKLSIEAALQLTNDNRASAAEMLGLSRQSLYVKLRRHGIADLSPGNGP